MLVALLALAGCHRSSGTLDDGGFGFTSPTLEVTVNGVHLGPAAPDPGSSASLVNTRDPGSNRITDSQFHVSATSQVGGGGCQLAFDRFGDGIFPVGGGAWAVTASSL